VKYILSVVMILLSSSVWAHDDNFLSDSMHQLYHIVFYSLLVLLIIIGGIWNVMRIRENKNKKITNKFDQ
jgi:flagellar biogenesis protein FliO